MQDKKQIRLAYLALLGLVWIVAIWGRLFWLQAVRYRELSQKAAHQQQRMIKISPRRGLIFDRNFDGLAMSVQADSIFAAPTEIVNLDNAVFLLSPVLQMDPAVLRARLQAGKDFSWIKRKVSETEARRAMDLNIKGLYVQKESARHYPNGDTAAHVLGFVNVDGIGQAGVEEYFDNIVKGRAGKLLVQADAHRRSYFRREEVAPDPGYNLVLTLDLQVQQIVEGELKRAIDETHAQAGTIVVMDPSTGEILALANYPTFSLNVRQDGDQENWANRAISSIYEPGSTMKIVTVSAALEAGLTRPDEVIYCEEGGIRVGGNGGRYIKDHKKFGNLTVTEIIAKSSDVGAIKLAIRLGDDRFARFIETFGLGSKTGIELPSESRGLVRQVRAWSKSSIGSLAMGQELGATPVQMAAATSVIAAGGVWHRPRILKGRFRQDAGDGITTAKASGAPGTPANWELPEAPGDARRVVSEETALKVRAMLEQVVVAGTGLPARLNGYTSAGKSGTAQKFDQRLHSYSPTDYVASFIGFAPVTRPAVTIAVILDSPVGAHHGGEVSGPVFKRVAERVLPHLGIRHDLDVASLRAAPAKKPNPEDLSDSAEVEIRPTPPPATNGTTVLVIGGSLVMPDYVGKAMRAVAEDSSVRGLDVDMLGRGVAREQWPAAGTKLMPGQRITVKFSQ